jgi:hypothetical protein
MITAFTLQGHRQEHANNTVQFYTCVLQKLHTKPNIY